MEVLEENQITCQITRKKIRHIYIQIKEGKVIVSAPKQVSTQSIQELLENKKDWIYKKLQQSEKRKKVEEKEYQTGEEFSVLGSGYLLQIEYYNKSRSKVIWQQGKLTVMVCENYKENKEQTQRQVEKAMDSFYHELAIEQVNKSMEKVTRVVGQFPKEVKIKRLKRVWGNCSSKKVISINQKLVMYSLKAIEYVVLHEVCHLQYMNHSKAFWNMVKTYMPDYKEVQKELK